MMSSRSPTGATAGAGRRAARWARAGRPYSRQGRPARLSPGGTASRAGPSGGGGHNVVAAWAARTMERAPEPPSLQRPGRGPHHGGVCAELVALTAAVT